MGAGEVQREFAEPAGGRRIRTALFRHGLRRATFPFGEGLRAANAGDTFG